MSSSRRDWGDYDDDLSEENTPVIFSSPTSRVPEVHQRYPVVYERHKSTYDRVLYDLSGNVLRDDEGKPLNVWRKDFEDYLRDKRIKGIRVPNGQHGFLYFVTNTDQQKTFREICQMGSMPFRAPLHVYVDDHRTRLPHE